MFSLLVSATTGLLVVLEVELLRLTAGAGMEDPAIPGDQSCAFFTLDILARTPNGVTSPTTVTFLAAKSMLKDDTPVF